MSPSSSSLFAAHRGCCEPASSSSRQRHVRRVMRRHPSYPPGAAGTVIAAWRAIHPFIVSKFQFFILILLLMLLWFTSTSTSIFAYNEDGSPNWNGSGSSSGVRRRQHLRGGNRPLILVHSDSQPFNEKSIATKATHLIIVAGHSVLISSDLQNAARDDSVWYMYEYQRNRGLPQAIVSHIQAGIQVALHDESSLLVFSGGQTRPQTGPEAEGGSYFRVADALELWDGRDVLDNMEDHRSNGDADTASASESVNETVNGNDSNTNGNTRRQHHHQSTSTTSTVRARTIAEEYATDSFENLLFSICRFHEVTGSYPQQITLISFSFKRQRFETLHVGAVLWPLHRFQYIGIDPPSSTGFDLQLSTEGERTNSLVPFQSDPYGCHSDILQNKRKERNPFSRRAPYELTCPDMKELLHWCGPEIITKDKVPWGGSIQ